MIDVLRDTASGVHQPSKSADQQTSFQPFLGRKGLKLVLLAPKMLFGAKIHFYKAALNNFGLIFNLHEPHLPHTHGQP